LHNQDSKTKPKQKRNLNQKKKIRGGAPKKCVKEFAYSLCRLKKYIKEKRNLIYVKAAFAMDLFVEYPGSHIYI